MSSAQEGFESNITRENWDKLVSTLIDALTSVEGLIEDNVVNDDGEPERTDEEFEAEVARRINLPVTLESILLVAWKQLMCGEDVWSDCQAAMECEREPDTQTSVILGYAIAAGLLGEERAYERAEELFIEQRERAEKIARELLAQTGAAKIADQAQ